MWLVAHHPNIGNAYSIFDKINDLVSCTNMLTWIWQHFDVKYLIIFSQAAKLFLNSKQCFLTVSFVSKIIPKILRVRGVFKTYCEFWISAGYVYSIFDVFVRRTTSKAILNVQLFFDSCFACTCFASSSIFAYSKKWIKESVSNFLWKTKLSARTHAECWLWHMVKLPWTEATFIGGTKCVPRAEKMWTTKSVPDARARQQQTKTWWREENSIGQSSNHR